MNDLETKKGLIVDYFFAECKRLSNMFNMPMLEQVSLSWELKGYSAGQAIKKKSFGVIQLEVRLNPEGLKIDFDAMKTVVLHELAHIIAFIDPRYGKGHDKQWKRTCLAIGGDGQRCHDIDLKPARKVTITRHIYNIGGKVYKFTNQQHAKLQTGRCSVRGIAVRASDHIETIRITK